MEQYVVALSKYFIALCMAIYTYESFSVFRFREEKQRKGIYTRQVILLFFVHFTCFLTVCVKTGELEYLFFYAFQQLAVVVILVMFEVLYPTINRLVIHNMCMLLVIGFVMLTRLDMHLAIRQFVIVLVSMAVAMVIPYFIHRMKELKNISWLYALLGILPLGVVLFLGSTTYGSKLSYSIFGISFQPSEFIKIIFVFFIASALHQSTGLLQVAYVTFVAGLHVLILVASRDLGSALIFFVTYVLMVFLATKNFWYLLLGVLGGSGASVIAYQLFRHVQERVQAWKDPWSVIDGEGYQITQSLFSLGRGGLFGLGLFQGAPEDIPKVERDFIFSAVSEEMGLIVALCVIMISLSCFIMFMNISMRLRDKFYQLVAFGMGTLYIFQVFLTIGGDTKFIPLTGVTLPLVSYGGSSIMTTLIMFSIIEGLYIIRQDEGAAHVRKKNRNAAGRQKAGAAGRTDSADAAGENKKKKSSLTKTKSRKKKKPNKNREILLVSYFFVFLFLGMMTYICVYVYQNQEVMINNSYNAGQQILVAQNRRGSIMARNGEVLAETITQADGSEVRKYPYDSLFSHVVGYSTKGKTGIEDKMNYYLIQSNAPLNEKMDNGMQDRKNPGDNVYTTLDVEIQEAANKALGIYEGAIVVTNPKTGEVLAMVSKPDYNPNEISEIWEELIEDDESSILLNRASQGLYPPGSTFKIVTALEYIHENPSTYTNYSFTCNGSIKIDGSRIQCYHGANHGKIGFEKSFAKSCNASFANMGTKVDWNSFSDTLDNLLFGRQLPFDLESSVSTVKAEADMSTKDQMQTAIGQGETLVTPLHMNMITCAIANDGVLQHPYVVDHVENTNGAVIKRFSSPGTTTMMTQQESYILQGLMREVVENGTATRLLGESYTAAGKTGSAEYNSERDSHAWFTGFAPVEDPQVCVTVIIEGAGSGGDYAVPIARRVFDAYFESN